MHDETALAEAEVEYENHTSPTVWVKYALLDDPAKIDAALAGKKVSTIIWTTTPWTLPASMAVAFHPDEEYVALESGGEVYIVAAKLAKDVAREMRIWPIRANSRTSPARKLERLNFQHPFLDRKILGVLADYVTMDTGTGVVHTAPSHGAEDFITGVKYGLDATSNVDEKGILRNGLPEYDGKHVLEANQPIIDLLQEPRRAAACRKDRAFLSALLALPQSRDFPRHRAVVHLHGNADARRSDRSKKTLCARARWKKSRQVKWDPAWGEERLSNMIATRPDWCISRQRVWGVPIAVFLCEGCGKPLNDPAVNRKVVELFARSGADAWFTPEADAILPAGTKCPHCAGTTVRKRNRHLRRLAGIRRKLSRAGRRRARLIPGPPIFISKAATSIAAGSSLPCSARWARTARRPTKAWSRPGGRSTKKARPCRSRAATTSTRSISPTGSAEKSCGSGSHPSTSAKTWSAPKPDAARRRKLSQDSQYLPLHPGQSLRFRSRRRRGAVREDGSARPVHAAPDLRFRRGCENVRTTSSPSTRSTSG